MSSGYFHDGSDGYAPATSQSIGHQTSSAGNAVSSDPCGSGVEQIITITPLAIQNQFKRCSCRKAKCLKLYCVCFAAGVYCSGCACQECVNLPEHQDTVMVERQRVLQRSPRAFMPKVEPLSGNGGATLHKKGCRCRKSRCLKKYCECFDAGAKCSNMCRCDDCQNRPDSAGPPVLAPQLHIDDEVQAAEGLVSAASGAPRSRRQMTLSEANAVKANGVQGPQPPFFAHSSARPPLPPSHNLQQPQYIHTQTMSMHALAAAAAAAEAGAGPCPPGDAAQYVLLPPDATAHSTTHTAAPAAAASAVPVAVLAPAAAGSAAAGDLASVSDLRTLFEDPEAVKLLTGQLGLADGVQQAAVNAARFLKDILSLSRQDPQALQRSLMAASAGCAAAAASQTASMHHQQQNLLPEAPPLSTGPMPPIQVAQQLSMAALHAAAGAGMLNAVPQGGQLGAGQFLYCVDAAQLQRHQQQQQQQQWLQQHVQGQHAHEPQLWQAQQQVEGVQERLHQGHAQQEQQQQQQQEQEQEQEEQQQDGAAALASLEPAATVSGDTVEVQQGYKLIDGSRCAPRTMRLTHGNFRIQAVGSSIASVYAQRQMEQYQHVELKQEQHYRHHQQQQQRQLAHEEEAVVLFEDAGNAASRTSSLQLPQHAHVAPQLPSRLPQASLQRHNQPVELHQQGHVMAYALQVQRVQQQLEEEQQQGQQQMRVHGWPGPAGSKAVQLQTGLTGCILWDPVAGTQIPLGDGAHIPVTMAGPLEAAALQAQLQQLQPGSRDATKALRPDTDKAARAAHSQPGEEGRTGEVHLLDHHSGESVPKRRRCNTGPDDAQAPSSAAVMGAAAAAHGNGLAVEDTCNRWMRSVANGGLPAISPSRASDSPSDHSCRFRDGMPVMTSPGAYPVSPSRPATRSRKGVLVPLEQGKENTQSQSPSVESFGEADAMRALCDLKHSHA